MTDFLIRRKPGASEIFDPLEDDEPICTVWDTKIPFEALKSLMDHLGFDVHVEDAPCPNCGGSGEDLEDSTKSCDACC